MNCWVGLPSRMNRERFRPIKDWVAQSESKNGKNWGPASYNSHNGTNRYNPILSFIHTFDFWATPCDNETNNLPSQKSSHVSTKLKNMATFTCSACSFSKPVKDEMAGKKARCPKCNEVNEIPAMEDVSEVAAVAPDEEAVREPVAAAAEPEVSTPPAVEQPVEQTAGSSTVGSSTVGSAAGALPKLSKGWILGFAGSGILLAIAAVLLSIQQVDLALICFAAGTIAFAVLSVMFVFADSFGKKK